MDHLGANFFYLWRRCGYQQKLWGSASAENVIFANYYSIVDWISIPCVRVVGFCGSFGSFEVAGNTVALSWHTHPEGMQQQKPYTLISALPCDKAIYVRGNFSCTRSLRFAHKRGGRAPIRTLWPLKMNFHTFCYTTARNRHGRRP